MKMTEISRQRTAANLNETLAKTFGQRIDLESFTLDQLQNARNKVRTDLRAIETTESFDATLKNEDYQKHKMYLDVLNAAISEMDNVQEAPGDRIPQANPTKPKTPNVSPNTSGMQMGMKPGPNTNLDFKAAWNAFEKQLTSGYNARSKDFQNVIRNLQNAKSEFMRYWNETQKKAPRTQTFNSMYDESIVYTKGSKLREGAQEQAELVMASKELVDTVGKWLQDTAEMQSESMLKLTDAIRDELGQEQADSFQQSVKPTLEALYQALEASRTALTQGVSLLTGEGAPAPEMGAEAPAEGGETAAEPEMEPVEGGEEMGAEMGDEFAGAEAAGGGTVPEGREQRESRIPLSHKLGTILSSKKK